MTTFRASSLADIDGFRATHSRMNAFAPSSQPKGMLRLPMPDWLTPSLKKIIRSSFSMANSESHMADLPHVVALDRYPFLLHIHELAAPEKVVGRIFVLRYPGVAEAVYVAETEGRVAYLAHLVARQRLDDGGRRPQ